MHYRAPRNRVLHRAAAGFAFTAVLCTATVSDAQDAPPRSWTDSDALFLAQAGSTGGTIGKTDKSASSPNNQPEIRRENSARDKRRSTSNASSEGPTSPCRNAEGTWAFSNGISVVIMAGGAATGSNGASGNWSCHGGMITAHWPRWTDNYAISSDGRRLSGTSGLLGMPLSAEKQ